MRTLPDGFQLEQLRAALCMFDRRNCALDVGAHRGIWTGEMLKHFDKVVAIEPTNLYKQIPKDALVINAACGPVSSFCSIRAGEKNDGQSYVVEGDDLRMITIDELDLKPDFIKIDVEGMEFDVLKGARNTIAQNKPYIMLEENILSERYGNKVGRACKLLRRWGMKPLITFHMFPEKDRNILMGWR